LCQAFIVGSWRRECDLCQALNPNVTLGEPATGDHERKTSHFFKGRRFAWTTLEENAGAKPAE
jgi:hypothetical protein